MHETEAQRKTILRKGRSRGVGGGGSTILKQEFYRELLFIHNAPVFFTKAQVW